MRAVGGGWIGLCDVESWEMIEGIGGERGRGTDRRRDRNKWKCFMSLVVYKRNLMRHFGECRVWRRTFLVNHHGFILPGCVSCMSPASFRDKSSNLCVTLSKNPVTKR